VLRIGWQESLKIAIICLRWLNGARDLKARGSGECAEAQRRQSPKYHDGPNGKHMMEASNFIDCYEILEISPNADLGTIERMFRYLAQRYHPDNQDTGDRLRFDAIMAAYGTLKDPVKRAAYDIQRKNHSTEQASDGDGIGRDVDIQNKLLSMLYVQRRRNIRDPGIGSSILGRTLDCPAEHVEFHLWYLKEKGWVNRTDGGAFAITAEGVDRANSEHHRKTIHKFLTDQRQPN
jgi:curved DNA-binding protein CbpA